MSHIVKLDVKIKCIESLAKAAQELGCELVRDQKTHRSYGNRPGKCDHAIRVKDVAGAYEIDVVKNAEGGYDLQADFFAGGRGLAERVGNGAAKLRQEYAAQVAIKQARKMGKRVTRSVQENGNIVLRAY